jgi:hypothetical protein
MTPDIGRTWSADEPGTWPSRRPGARLVCPRRRRADGAGRPYGQGSTYQLSGVLPVTMTPAPAVTVTSHSW